MILSMTGFASKTATFTLEDGSKINISIDLKTLNSRFFETTCKLSYSINHLETALIRLLKSKLLRGHAYLTMHVLNPQALQGKVKPSIATIEGYANAIELIKKDATIEGALSVSDLLRLPDVFEVEEKEIDHEFEAQLLKTVESLADQVVSSRQQEGAILANDLKDRITTMKKEMANIEVAANELMEKKKQEITEAIQEVEETESESADARKSALYISLDKMDVHEEIVRFKSHLANFAKQLETSNPEKGKRIDFTLQELAREINTLSSKCSDAAISSQAINIKVEIEKCREQTQNIV